jgi:hypothetical protein
MNAVSSKDVSPKKPKIHDQSSKLQKGHCNWRVICTRFQTNFKFAASSPRFRSNPACLQRQWQNFVFRMQFSFHVRYRYQFFFWWGNPLIGRIWWNCGVSLITKVVRNVSEYVLKCWQAICEQMLTRFLGDARMTQTTFGWSLMISFLVFFNQDKD